MRKSTAGLLGLALATSVGASLTIPTATAGPSTAPATGSASEPQAAPKSDSLPDPINDKQQALREEAVSAVINGEATPQRIGNSTVVQVGDAATAASSDRAQRFHAGHEEEPVR